MKIFAANWKLNKNPAETEKFFAEFLPLIKNQKEKSFVVFPSATCLSAAVASSRNSNVEIGAQNVWKEAVGAFTGETSASVVKDMNATWVLIGHSERRQYFNEVDELLSAKLKLVESLGLKSMFCIGETLPERETGKTNEVLKRQISKGLAGVSGNSALVVAYEPVWAIGTGKVATIDQVENAHGLIRQEIGKSTPILYGGSVKPDNAKSLLAVANVDGFLVGGASLDAKSFAAICGAG